MATAKPKRGAPAPAPEPVTDRPIVQTRGTMILAGKVLESSRTSPHMGRDVVSTRTLSFPADTSPAMYDASLAAEPVSTSHLDCKACSFRGTVYVPNGAASLCPNCGEPFAGKE